MIDTLSVYIPMDRRQALAKGVALPDRAYGAALFADVSGFTALTEALANELGPQRGAEELSRHLNLVYDALIAELHRYGGSAISFTGDAITCWFDGAETTTQLATQRAVACGLAMQKAMGAFVEVTIPSGRTVSLAVKVAVATGPARRFVVGDPVIQVMDVLAGTTLDNLSATEKQAGKGEVVLHSSAAEALGNLVRIASRSYDESPGQRPAVVSGLTNDVAASPWPALSTDALNESQIRPWLLPPVYTRLMGGQGEFLAELRPAVALFLRFSGIDYDADDEAGDKLNAYIRQVQSVFARYEGALMNVNIGDKGSALYAAFGAPLAHEDDAARAASAALELRLPSLNYIRAVQIGISQGRMRTGAYGSGECRTYGVLGDDVNLAARLMQAAAPGQILASRGAQQSASHDFNWEGLAAIKVKGKTEPVDVYNLRGQRARQAVRLQEINYTIPMVGRAEELAAIEQKMAQVMRGHGQIAGITAEAGMGKSRLMAEVIRLANEYQLTGYGGECLSYGTNTSYLVWHSIWRSFFGVDPEWDLAQQVKALRRQLQMIDPALTPRLPLLDAALNLPIPDDDFTRDFDAKLRKTSREALLADCLRGRARFGPLFLVLEDCHWIDPLSNDLLEVIGRAIADLPILLVMSYRPMDSQSGQTLRVSQLPHFSETKLNDFTPQEAERLISLKLEQFFGAQTAIPQDFIGKITDKAQGNPFYIEELLNYLQDRKIDPRNSQALEQLDFPANLHSLILSRMDQLTEDQKSTIKVASIIGRQFKAAMLWGAYSQLVGDEPQVRANLEALGRLDLTPLDTPDPELEYLFKHIITHEVAYESLPYALRATLHDQIAQYIERTFSKVLEQWVAPLAFHYGRSENTAKKREYWLKAVEAAQANYDNKWAIDYYQQVLPLLTAEEQVPVMLKLGGVLELVGRWAETGDSYLKALALTEQLGDRRAQAQCQTVIGEFTRKRSQYTEASDWLAKAQAIFEDLGDRAGVAQVLHYAGSLAAQQGNYNLAQARYEASLVLRQELDDKTRIGGLLSNLGIIARLGGNYEQARAYHEEGLAIRREVGDRSAIAHSLNNLANVALDQGNYAEARARHEEAATLRRQIGDRWAEANSLNNLGNVARAQGDYAAARSMYQESLTINNQLGDRWATAYLLEDMGGLASLEGQPERAFRLVGAAAGLREAIGSPLSPAEKNKLEALLANARQALDETAWNSLIDKGRALTLPEAVQYALQN
ncbi:MAG: tetratricopeptide repeat protein [Chloroflexi bacterium]|nr:tetratricopeptide repeat protein [Chloroflexota bacterium]